MGGRLFSLNVIITIADTLIAALAILAFAWGSMHFERWWILLLNIIPLALFNSHTLILNSITEEGESDS